MVAKTVRKQSIKVDLVAKTLFGLRKLSRRQDLSSLDRENFLCSLKTSNKHSNPIR